MSWDAGLWDSALWDLTEGDSSFYYYRRKHLPNPEPTPPVPDASKVDWSIGATQKEKLDRDIRELSELNRELQLFREKEWLKHMKEHL